MSVTTRFAPSPTGHLHIGGARTAIFSWLLARHFKGEFRFRIEDTDLQRSRQEYTDSILASMQWLGLTWEGETTYQTKRMDVYNKYVDQLLESGHAYWCSCTAEEVDAMRERAKSLGLKPRYDGHCRELGLGPGEGRCVRLKCPLQGKVVFDDMVKGRISIDVAELDDMVIRRSDGTPTYNMAVVVDDHDMGITHVIRGDDHVSNTPRQILIYQALGFEVPTFGHVPMILGPDGAKLSKRHGARAVIEYQKDGLLPQALVNYLVRLGWSHGDQEIFSLEELVELFDGTHLNPSAARFDSRKLEWLNGHYMKKLPVEELARLTRPFAEDCGYGALSDERLQTLFTLFRDRARTLVELAASIAPMLKTADELEFDPACVEKQLNAEGRAHLEKLLPCFEQVEDFSPEPINEALKAYVEGQGLKFKQVAPPLRAAVVGYMGGSHLPDIMAFLGKEDSLARIRKAIALG
ncbi:MAG: glutamate--tRNA ligase [Desulfovibrio sp.]|nr:glutamate--tRNA ligase [Desulfovibrio sp.]